MRKVLRFRILSLLAIGLALVVSLSLAGAKWATTHAAGLTPAQTSPASCPPVIKVASSRSPGSAGNELEAIATISASNIWAVGEFTNTGGSQQTLIEHWNGSSWRVVSSPSPGSGDELFGIAAVSASDIWAAGDFQNTSGVEQTLFERWNGSSWRVVPSPNPGSSINNLAGIAAVSASDLWAAGTFISSSGLEQPLIEHWNGSSWRVVSSPSPGSSFNFLDGIAAVSASDLWAVGAYGNTGGSQQALIERWNGSSWRVVPSPSPDSGYNELHGIAVVSASDIWAAGDFANSGGLGNTLFERWNGSGWSVVSSPSPGSGFNRLLGVATVNGNLWAVGGFNNTGGPEQTLIEHGCA